MAGGLSRPRADRGGEGETPPPLLPWWTDLPTLPAPELVAEHLGSPDDARATSARVSRAAHVRQERLFLLSDVELQPAERCIFCALCDPAKPGPCPIGHR